MSKDKENENERHKNEDDDLIDLDDIDESKEFIDEPKGKKTKNNKTNKGQSKSANSDYNDSTHSRGWSKSQETKSNRPERDTEQGIDDGYLMGEDKGTRDNFDDYLQGLERDSGMKDYKEHKRRHGTTADTGENFRRNYYGDDYKNSKDKPEDDTSDIVFTDSHNSFDKHQEKEYNRNQRNQSNEPYSVKDEVRKYGGRDLLTKAEQGLVDIDDVLRNKTSTGNKNVDKSLDAIRSALEYDIARAVERDKQKMMDNMNQLDRRPTEKDFQRLEDKHKRKKEESLRKRVTEGIKTSRTKENKAKFKAFMDSKEVKLALNLIGVFGGAYGKAFVKAVRIFTIFWGLNFTWIIIAVLGITAILGVLIASAVFVVVMTLGEGTVDEVEVEVGEEKTSSSVEVPAGYEGKMMYPVESTLRSSRGYTGVGGHLGQDISGGGENVYPIYPGKVILSGKNSTQCGNSGGSSCSTLKNESQGIYFNGDGNAVQVAHDLGDGKYIISYYMHMRPQSIEVEEGQMVGYGTPIGKVGNSGNSYGEHLHVEIYDNVEKGFFDNGRSHYSTSGQWYYTLINKTIAPPPLWTCGGKSGVAVNSAGLTNTPQSCLEDAREARNK